MKIHDVPFAVVDIETTGSSLERDRVIEVGAVKVHKGKIIDTFQALVNPEMRIPFFISFMTGIKNRMVKKAPVFSDIAGELQQFLSESIFVAHNARFDHDFIRTELLRARYPIMYNTNLCTIKLARRVFPGFTHYNLRDLSYNLGIPLIRAHRALDDSIATAKILLLILKRLEEIGVSHLCDLERIYQLSPQECREFFFRKNSRYTLEPDGTLT